MVMRRLREILAEQFMLEEDEITSDTSMAIEEEFEISEIEESDLKNIITVGDLAQYITDRID